MDINLLVVNVGNTRVGFGLFEKGELSKIVRVAIEDKNSLVSQLKECWSKIATSQQPAVCGASVNPVVMKSVEQSIFEVTGQNVEWIGSDIDLPMKVLTKNPQQTGVDRVLTMAAAFEQIEKACVVVDAGTAITVNVCNGQGEFMGGAILPGLHLMLASLHEKTAGLPKVDFEVPTVAIGTDTVEAIRVGMYLGIRGMVKEIVEAYATELGSWPDLIATGGDAEKLFGGWELVHAVSPDLVFYGIALAYTNHYIKHGE